MSSAAQAREQRIAQALMRALAEDLRCERCNAPFNRWDEPCKPEMSTVGLLAQDVLWLLDQLEAK